MLKQIDKGNMLELLLNFSEMAERTINVKTKIKVKAMPENIVIAGMGGSAISGNLLIDWLEHKLTIPIHVCRNYLLPNFVNKKSLVIAISYSGNTEETISAFNDARERKAMIICITSGGKLEEVSKRYRIPFVSVEKGIEPRAALPYLFFSLIRILREIGLVKDDNEIKETITILKRLRNELKLKDNIAKTIAKKIKNMDAAIIYAPSGLEGVATRIKTQLNENSKTLSWVGVIPEINHNEITGWSKKMRFCVIFLRDRNETKKIRARIEFTKRIIRKRAKIIELWARGKTKLAKMFSLILLGDFISFYLAIINKIDPTPVPLHDKIKKYLMQIRNG
ncbi:MAG: bifunctional phosphoglucose/phosphomannose isomerase [Candidatus Aenigmatarchaeota archaeon]